MHYPRSSLVLHHRSTGCAPAQAKQAGIVGQDQRILRTHVKTRMLNTLRNRPGHIARSRITARSPMTKKPAKSKTNGKPAAAKTPPPAPTTRTTTEQTLRELQKAIEGKSFANPAEASAFLQTLLGSGAMESLLDDVPLSL